MGAVFIFTHNKETNTMTRTFVHNGQRPLTHNQRHTLQMLPTFEALAQYFDMMQPHEQKVFRQFGAEYAETGEIGAARAHDWAKDRLEFYKAKAAKAKGLAIR
jgi:hypothetical protein